MWAAHRTGTLVLGVGCLERPRSGSPHVTDSESSCLEVDKSMDGAYCRDIVSKILCMVHISGKKSSQNNHQKPSDGLALNKHRGFRY